MANERIGRKTWQNNFYTRDIYLINANADANSIAGIAAPQRVANVQNVNVPNAKIRMWTKGIIDKTYPTC
jgi:hypothetical protein